MSKYLQVFHITWQNSFVYRLNFLMWRARSFLLLFSTYFIWLAVFRSTNSHTIFNYEIEKLVTYLMLVALLGAVVFASRTIDLSWMINSGDLSNLVTKPLSVIRYFFCQDAADKLLNIIFLGFEVGFFFLLFRPQLFWQSDMARIIWFGLAVALAVVLYFLINFLLGLLGFWTNQVWAARFLYMTIADVLAGSLFPLDILPPSVYSIIRILPFHWLVFFPNQIYLGRISMNEICTGLVIQTAWIVILAWLVKKVWHRGMLKYSAEGR